MSEQDLDALLADVRRSGLPSAARVARVRVEVVGAAPIAVATSSAALPMAASVIAIAIAGVIVFAGAHHPHVERAPHKSAQHEVIVAVPPAPAPAEPPIATPEAPPPPTPPHRERRFDLREETALIGGALEALRAGDPTRALAILDQHAHRFPNGALAVEREEARVDARAALEAETPSP